MVIILKVKKKKKKLEKVNHTNETIWNMRLSRLHP